MSSTVTSKDFRMWSTADQDPLTAEGYLVAAEMLEAQDSTIAQQAAYIKGQDEGIESQAIQIEQANKRIEALTNAGNDLIDSAGGSPRQQFNISVIRWDNLISDTEREG